MFGRWNRTRVSIADLSDGVLFWILFILKSSNCHTSDCVVVCPGFHCKGSVLSSRQCGREQSTHWRKRKGKRFQFFSSSAMTPCRLTLCCSFIVIAVRQPVLTAKANVSPKEAEWCFFFFSFDVHLLTQYQADGCAFVISVCLFHYHLLSEEASCSPLYLCVLGICEASLMWLCTCTAALWKPVVRLVHGFCLQVGVTSSL